MKKGLIFLAGLVSALIILIMYENLIRTDKKDHDTEIKITDSDYEQPMPPDSCNSQVIKVIHSPESITFAGEEVPLHYFDVRESLERELNQIAYSHQQTLLTIRLSGRYFRIIDSILQKNGVPEDFKYLCVAESNLQNLISPAKAVGFWQFLSETGKEYNLEINDEIDERYSIEKSTVAACEYLKESYKKYGSWTLAAASYNTGRKNIDNVVENQKTSNYHDMMLNSETIRYIYRILAYKIVFDNPELYGFYVPENDKYKSFKYYEITLNYSIKDLADFAKKYDTNYKMIKLFNPWLRKNILTNSKKKSYKIKIPTKDFRNAD
ncbi:MAG: lytic transglycosylase domain-containing protein [Prevotellaceae bacterium]|nr:lytic transglycosylase domain-containing protein [Prevotellaceae bacterium]